MLKNNKGTILVVAVVATSIMIIIGFVCLKIYSNQSMLDTKDVLNQRLYYSAIGSVEAMKGFISEKVAENIQSRNGKPKLQGDFISENVNDGGFLFNKTHSGPYKPFEGDLFGDSNIFDASMHPAITTHVSVTLLNRAVGGTFYFKKGANSSFPSIGTAATSKYKGYVIEAKASASLKTALNSVTNMEVTARYYFYTTRSGDGTVANIRRNTITPVGWRIIGRTN